MAAKDFDVELRQERYSRERTFRIGGEDFKFRIGLIPEEYAEMIEEYAKLDEDAPAREAIRVIDQTICNFLDDTDTIARWKKLRKRKTEPITTLDMRTVVLYLIEEQMGRPTEAGPPSTNGDSPTEATSTEPSSSVPAGVVVSEG